MEMDLLTDVKEEVPQQDSSSYGLETYDHVGNCDIVEVEINPKELSELLAELSTIRGLQTQVIEENEECKIYSSKETTKESPTINQQEFVVSTLNEAYSTFEDSAEYKILDDETYDETDADQKNFPLLDDNKPTFYAFEESYDDHTDEDRKDLIPEYKPLDFTAREQIVATDISLVLKRLDEYMLTKFLKTRHQHVRVRLLETIIENHARAEMFPNITEPTKLGVGQWMCHKCYNLYSERKLVVRHLKETHEKTTSYKCEFCPRSFVSFGTLTTHVQHIHNQISRYDCPKCEEFKSQRKIPLVEHLVDVHGIPESEADSLIKSNYKLNYDNRKHQRERYNLNPVEPENICRLCKKEFLDEDSLNKHLCLVRVRAIEKLEFHSQSANVLSCPLCNEIFEHLDFLKEHYLKLHAENGPEAMEYQEEVRQLHESRLKKKKIGGDSISVEFEGNEEIPGNPILCDQCPFTTKSVQYLEQHISAMHSKESKYVCVTFPPGTFVQAFICFQIFLRILLLHHK